MWSANTGKQKRALHRARFRHINEAGQSAKES